LRRVENLQPGVPLPTLKTDLKALDAGRDTVVWLGHSSFFVLFSGKRLLIDPVFSPYAAPVSLSTQAFAGTTLYATEDMPEIDALLITHDHWDHLDHATVTALEPQVRRVLVPLGVGAHLEHWGYTRDKIHEADWFGKLELADGSAIHAVPARHYSGRLLDRNRTLWAGFVLESGKRRILFGGDSGYGPHYAELARRFGGFDLVALDMGQYDARWPYIHMTPEEAAQAAMDLNLSAHEALDPRRPGGHRPGCRRHHLLRTLGEFGDLLSGLRTFDRTHQAGPLRRRHGGAPGQRFNECNDRASRQVAIDHPPLPALQLQPVPAGSEAPEAGPDDADQRQRKADPQV
jgi:L-ascorbate metabolism protein UlaG (beta-lactamase superfamily)